MTTIDTKICNFNCMCVRDGCSFKHYLETFEDRKAFKQLFDDIIKNTPHNEPDPDGIRKKNCLFGMLCNNEDCGFKHFCDYDSRISLRKYWYKQSFKTKNMNFLEELNEKYSFTQEDYDALKRMIERK